MEGPAQFTRRVQHAFSEPSSGVWQITLYPDEGAPVVCEKAPTIRGAIVAAEDYIAEHMPGRTL